MKTNYQKGIAQVLVIAIMAFLALGIPTATKLVQENQENRSKATEDLKEELNKPTISLSTKPCVGSMTDFDSKIIQKWTDDNTLVINTQALTYCGGATISTPTIAGLENNKLTLSYQIKVGSTITKCVCPHQLTFIIKNLPKNEYIISLKEPITTTSNSTSTTNIKVSPEVLKLKVDQTETISYTLDPSNSADEVKWGTSDDGLIEIKKTYPKCPEGEKCATPAGTYYLSITALKAGTVDIKLGVPGSNTAHVNVIILDKNSNEIVGINNSNYTQILKTTPIPITKLTSTPIPITKLTSTPSPTHASVPASGIKVTPTSLELQVGQVDTLTYKLDPSNSTDKVKWSVDTLGLINIKQDYPRCTPGERCATPAGTYYLSIAAIKPGTAKITLTTTSGETAQVKITVTNSNTSEVINGICNTPKYESLTKTTDKDNPSLLCNSGFANNYTHLIPDCPYYNGPQCYPFYSWTCLGANGGKNSKCSVKKIVTTTSTPPPTIKPTVSLSIKYCVDSMDEFDPKITQKWINENTLEVKTQVMSYCGGATISTPSFSLNNDKLTLKYQEKIGEAITLCVCPHQLTYTINNLPKKEYKIVVNKLVNGICNTPKYESLTKTTDKDNPLLLCKSGEVGNYENIAPGCPQGSSNCPQPFYSWTCLGANGGKSSKCSVKKIATTNSIEKSTTSTTIPVTAIRFIPTSLKLKIGQTKTIGYILTPNNSTDKFKWKIYNHSLVKAKIIYPKCADGTFGFKCITINNRPKLQITALKEGTVKIELIATNGKKTQATVVITK